MSTVSDAVTALAACPKCRAAIDVRCTTKTKRNHTQRVRAALIEAIAQEGEDRGLSRDKLGLPKP